MNIRIDAQWYPLAVENIEKILPDPAVVPVPRAPAGVVGLLYYAGQAVPLLVPDISGPAACPRRFAVLLRRPDGQLLGVPADEIAEAVPSEGDDFD